LSGAIHGYLSSEHGRLDGLLRRSVARPAAIDMAAFDELRRGLLRHIAMEEKVLFPMARALRPGEIAAMIERLHREHAALAALLVPAPTHDGVETIRRILVRHNPIEEGPGGLYEACEAAAGPKTDDVVARLRGAPVVRTAPYVDSPRVRRRIAELLRACDIPKSVT
jgi:hemerythrin HHE cation binding domain-containing protein